MERQGKRNDPSTSRDAFSGVNDDLLEVTPKHSDISIATTEDMFASSRHSP